ncbi:phosphate ABC transporter membrane protein 2, PhoT family (TC 3.A.1.7.1) [Streptoalloteichus tenebrarius]|uniref:Phosphate transport system permease protein PstA n=1 Tax=Streptoalloteichus tenebrarius (strain ATCC 17920 / DSM 40477 / JCM 4838 / CBS 697.72 / NBRC 16177 / NCIMB 11028 / NRRL B-12390 / A12253. 1 / ISP 5477) TaxID=1933 RepID=A0ABT1HV44_STRSD|nr:phosphate ABC transporter permease PstA [Streptoalloteichus tenebrarius]MCP2259391.1 phosphate ABC transporter membrane protein 2, PhoT family (TC 3.A.1.7.1) [Streptoalloteichus tenebrarius]BFF02333.1 phosphate ABC transporter permease PstA [Streptoalloteichus tenebrarius]
MTTATTDLHRPATGPAFQGVGLGRKVKNAVATTLVALAFLVAVVPLVWVLWSVLEKGLQPVLHADWWTHSLYGLRPYDDRGGAYHAIYGTVVQALSTAVLSVPVGVMVGVYLVEYGAGTRLARVTTFMVDILTGVPSIVAGLFVYALWISILGFGRSGFAVSLSLLLLMIPVVIRTTEEMLRIVPNELREASYALGVPKWKTIVKIVLPTAMSGIVTGVMLGLARVMGETAPALIVGAYASSINLNVFDGNQANLPLLMNDQFANPETAGFNRTWGAAMTLVLIIMLFNLLATVISRLSAIKK